MIAYDKIYKQEVNLRDPRFDVEQLAQYRLYVCIGDDHLKVLVLNAADNRCMLLEDYRFFTRLSSTELLSALTNIYDSHICLKANYWQQVRIMRKGQAFTLVPKKVFVHTQSTRYLVPLVGEGRLKTQQIYYSDANHLEAVEIFAVDTDMVSFFKTTYPNREFTFFHQAAPFIESIYQLTTKPRQTQVHILVESSYMMVVVQRGGKLELCNMYPYRTAQDFIYFVLFVLDELRLERETCEMRIYGMINPVSEIFKILRLYIAKVQIVNTKPTWLAFSHEFDSLPYHYYFDMFGLPLLQK
jgi:Protein of unknown function (DUF3822)